MNDSTTPNAPALEPLYHQICNALLPDSTLPPDFALSCPRRIENGVSFADGAFDGISLYHMAPEHRSIQPLIDVLALVGEDALDEAEEKLAVFFSSDEYISMLSMADDIQEWILSHKESIHPAKMTAFATGLLSSSCDVESVKFALVLLELIDLSQAEVVQTMVRTLALSDEFTLFSLFTMRRWSDANAQMFDLAKRVHGWGRIHIVDQIEPTTPEIRSWLLCQGWINTVMEQYSALPCVQKSGLADRLAAKDLNAEELASAGALLACLLSDGPVEGISGIEDPKALLNAYVNCVGDSDRKPDLRTCGGLLAIAEWADKNGAAALAAHCHTFLVGDAAVAAIQEAMSQGDGFTLAKSLGMDYSKEVLMQLQDHFTERYTLASLLLTDKEQIDGVLTLFEKKLPLAEMATGPAGDKGMEPEHLNDRILAYVLQYLPPYPGRGEALIQCALNNPVVLCRLTAIGALAAWKSSGATLSDELIAAVEALKKNESVELVKKRLSAL